MPLRDPVPNPAPSSGPADGPSSSADAVAFDVRGLRAGYVKDVDIVRNCDVRVDAGQLVSIIGPNGAGKSTLVKAVFGLVNVRAGEVLLYGSDVAGMPTHRLVAAGVGYVPQVGNVFPSLTAEENLRMGCYLAPRERARRTAQIYELLPLLADRRSQRAGTMSGGQRQVVALARALMGAPRVLLLDEPSAGLDPNSVRMVFREIRRIADSGLAVLMVEQNARRALASSDYAYVLDMGENRFEGPGPQLLADDDVVRLYLGGLSAS